MIDDLARKLIKEHLFDITNLIQNNKSINTFISTLDDIRNRFSSDFPNIYTVVTDYPDGPSEYTIYGCRYETDEEYKERLHSVLKDLEFKDKVLLHQLILNGIGNL